MASIGGASKAFRVLRALRCRLGGRDDIEVQDKRAWEQVIDIIGESGDFLFRFFPPRRLHHFITCTDAMGEGAFGVVSLGKPTRLGLRRMPLLEEGRAYAVKCTDARKLRSSKASILTLPKERILEYIGAMRAPDCADANIIRCFAFMLEVPRGLYYEVMELLEGPDLHGFLARRSRLLAEATAAGLARQMFTALNYLHRRAGILHRDVKPENFGFERPPRACDERPDASGLVQLPRLKLFDFGLAWALRQVVDDASAHDVFPAPLAGTALYMAPEVWRQRCGPPSDVWGAGLITYLMLSLDMPFGLATCRSSFERALKENPLAFPEDRWADVSAGAKALVAASLTRDPRQRCSAEEALSSRWLSSPPAKVPADAGAGTPAVAAQAVSGRSSNGMNLPAGASV